MLRRFLLYFFGFSIGCVMVYFSLIKDRDEGIFPYLPNDRVIKKISVGVNLQSEPLQCKLKCVDMDTTDFKVSLKKGVVNFDKSKAQEDPATYLVEGKDRVSEKIIYQIQFFKTSQKAALVDILNRDIKSCGC